MKKRKTLKKIIAVVVGAIALVYIASLISYKGYELPMEVQEVDTDRELTVAVFGATGTVGDGLLKAVIEDPRVKHVKVFTRRSSPRIEAGVESGKVEMTIHTDYLDYTTIRDNLSEVDAVYWAIGLSAVGLDEASYREIHLAYPARFVEAWAEASSKANRSFHYVSGSGAEAGSRMMWARVKASAEAHLTGMAGESGIRVVSYRPAFIFPTDAEAHVGHKLMHATFSPIGLSVAAESIGSAMLEVSVRGSSFPNGTVLENKDIIAVSKVYAGQ